jgi:hypothetical protein
MMRISGDADVKKGYSPATAAEGAENPRQSGISRDNGQESQMMRLGIVSYSGHR